MGQVKDINNFKAIKNGSKASKGYKSIPFKLVFDVKFDIRHKSSLISVGYHKEDPNWDDLSIFVSLDVVRTVLFMDELNDLGILDVDVGDSYLPGYTKNKVYTISGTEFGDCLEGIILIIVMAL